MPTLLARRLVLGVATLLVASMLVFAATQLLPGDAARAVLGRTATPESLAAFRTQFGLDRPLLSQYWSWLSGVLTGDPGTSTANSLPVWGQVEPRLVNSLYLLVLVAIVAIPLAIALGAWSAFRRDRALDHTLTTASLAAAALPEFVVAIGLTLLFATGLFKILPPVSLVPPGTSVWADPQVLVLPVLTLTIAVVISAVVSLTLTPMMCARLLRHLAGRQRFLRHHFRPRLCADAGSSTGACRMRAILHRCGIPAGPTRNAGGEG